MTTEESHKRSVPSSVKETSESICHRAAKKEKQKDHNKKGWHVMITYHDFETANVTIFLVPCPIEAKQYAWLRDDWPEGDKTIVDLLRVGEEGSPNDVDVTGFARKYLGPYYNCDSNDVTEDVEAFDLSEGDFDREGPLKLAMTLYINSE